MSVERLLQRMKDKQAELARELVEDRRKSACAQTPLGCALPIGARVLDRVTGEVGEVIGGQVENIVIPAAGQPDGGSRPGETAGRADRGADAE